MGYTKGLHEVTENVHAYLQPDGGWGRSNTGLIRGTDSALLVDTCFDAPLTRQMLDRMSPLTAHTPIEVAVNTHGDGDHWFGNYELPAGVDIVAAEAAVAEMHHLTPQALAALAEAELEQPMRDYLRRAFGAFAFAESGARLPGQTFTGRLELTVGGTLVELIEVGPAHTAGDLLVHVPSARTVFTGDILFIGSTPLIWAGPVDNWIAACDTVLGLGAEHIIPGHGPATDAEGVRAVQRYLRFVRDEARRRFDAGLDVPAAAADIELGEFAGWLQPERLAANVDRLYREFDPERPATDKVTLFGLMAQSHARRA
ncbi:MBL fold metallo-hydrolase [Amycolatopsis cihanbeyliensis]|uniref:MBL fold metallo-hydrolase n=1 Tax=Amycolatopsis cihanbeyliensis TaxID=1128664 RepID=UPI001FE62FA6|nr:MBL fold metallo-hydrolase [Amycolatopsis cihanbeyliensis]